MAGAGWKLLLASALCLAACRGREEEINPRLSPPTTQIRFLDATTAAGLERWSPTFGAAVADLDNDGRDDLLVGNHSYVPTLFLQTEAGVFQDISWLLDTQRTDLHGITALDLDNDGDRDLAIACGGADGIGAGCENQLHENLLADLGSLAFRNIGSGSNLARQTWRTRHFIPIAAPDGAHVDLFMTCLAREGYPCLYFSNLGGSGIHYSLDPAQGLNHPFNTEGLGVALDFDRDGDTDLLIISSGQAFLLECREDGYVRNNALLPRLQAVYCAAAGDLNNDGYDDLFLGCKSTPGGGDCISASTERIHFVVHRQNEDNRDSLSFRISGNHIEIDFIQHTPGYTIRDPGNIFIGPDSTNPPSRQTTISAALARGEPLRESPGIYIWLDGSERWHLEWVYAGDENDHRGKVMAVGIRELERSACEAGEAGTVCDRIFLNQRGLGFFEQECPALVHRGTTRGIAICDFDNNGHLDVAGIRGDQPGEFNGDPFLVYNRGSGMFEVSEIMLCDEDDLFQADQMVWGFFNGDGLPDLFLTNGYGLNPGHQGPYRLWLNASENTGGFVILQLQGTKCNRDALGTDVEVVDAQGKLLGYRRLGTKFNRSQSTLKVHIGLGSHKGALRARIRWSGSPDWEVREIEAGRVNTIRQ